VIRAAAVALALAAAAPVWSQPAGAPTCSPGLAVIRLADGVELARAPADGFALSYRHSVTLTRVRSEYRITPGGLRQSAERFADLGPGMAQTGPPPRRDGEGWVLAMDTAIPRLILRPQHEAGNTLHLPGLDIDLTPWTGQPLEFLALPCL